MSLSFDFSNNSCYRTYKFPASHWTHLSRFAVGNERDPKDLFFLAEDVWDAFPYSAETRSVEAQRYRFRFKGLQSFLKLYVKCYCYDRLIGRGTLLSQIDAALPRVLYLVDKYIIEHGFQSLEDISSPIIFSQMWDAQLLPHNSDFPRPKSKVWRQERSSPFWMYLREQFGSPQVVPPVAPYAKKSPNEYGADRSQIIPTPVIQQLVNKLALHRDGLEKLIPFHHLRLCILVLSICLGRRICEILSTKRGSGTNGPLSRFPTQGAPSKDALWFEFCPNKNGPNNKVYVSPEWENIVEYCVQQLIQYSDEVRSLASTVESNLLILVSTFNLTTGGHATLVTLDTIEKLKLLGDKRLTGRGYRSMKTRTTSLSYSALQKWLNGYSSPKYPKNETIGILRLLNITIDGSVDGDIYKLRLHQARHTRQSALAEDPNIPFLARQRDLNHASRDMQFAYQHSLYKQNDELLQKVKQGKLYGSGVAWLSDILETNYCNENPKSNHKAGVPSLLTPRWRKLIQENPQFLQLNWVGVGYCSLPQGPQVCEECMNCLEAEEGGCQWFAVDLENQEMILGLMQRASDHRTKQQESVVNGRRVQAGKFEILADRSEHFVQQVEMRTSDEMRILLKKRKQQIMENGV